MSGILCEHCTAVCCRYIALPIDTPKDREDFDYVRWYLMHEGIGVFVEDGDWYITMSTSCRHVQADNRCGVYATRPKICREYTTESCDYHSGDYNWSQHFTCPEHLDVYVREYFKNKRKASTIRKTKSFRNSLNRKKLLNPAPAHGRRGLQVKLGPGVLLPHREHAHRHVAEAPADIRGVQLPLLPVAPS
ncbi:hypothetical protein RAS1_30440 [Phycisphaerae bacterium RAS1]|nr:hypothetical protein RAS1_30440 [Phycisphaerae bacterium RAS1]